MVALLQLTLIGIALLLEVSAAAFFGQNALVSLLFGAAAVGGLHRASRGEESVSLYLLTCTSAAAFVLHLVLWSSAP